MHLHRARRPLAIGLAALVACVLFAAACTGGHATATGQSGRPAGTAITPSLPAASPLSSTDVLADPIVAVVRAVSPAVVNVTNSTVEQNAAGFSEWCVEEARILQRTPRFREVVGL